jgi:putative oxidoreductase
MADLKAAGSSFAPLVLRAALGAIFVYHGAVKLGLADPARSWDTTVAAVNGFAGHLDKMGVPAPQAAAWATVLTEFLGGAFVLLGFATRIASLGLVAVMVVAIEKVHAQYGFSGTPAEGGGVHPGYEFNLMIIAGALALALLGSGPLALDPLFARFRKKGEGK